MIKDLLIESNRLIIRPYNIDDLEQSFQLMQSKELYEFLEFDLLPFEEYQGLFHWLVNSYEINLTEEFKYSFPIILKETNQMIGWCGIGILDFNKPEKEVYYLIGKDYWNQGFASEAMKSFIEYCFNALMQHRIVAKVNEENIASKRIIENLGFHFEYVIKDLPEEFSHCNGELFYSLTREDFVSNT
ncbi:GNAT family N-acetyltransferase [Cohnella suwonensis]|uniref:GNAT family N-acetyltransferase n=1 Tax=Cohnella suwonensis TaxID=696072 RepID=A0ABW0LZL8_9BACL